MTTFSQQTSVQRLGWFCLLLAVFTSAGCSSSTPKAKLTGKVTVGTEALDGGTLVFVPVDSSSESGNGQAQIDDEGKYSATIANPGKMKVYVVPPTPPPLIPRGKSITPPKDSKVPDNVSVGGAAPPRRANSLIPKKNTDPRTTDFRIELEPGTHEVNIEFKK
jgi:hypothetical protein